MVGAMNKMERYVEENMTAEKITELLRQRYEPPEWAFFSELRVGTGYVGHGPNPLTNPEQRLDGWAINCYPSKGLTTIALEIKTSRSDYLREIANPEKRQQAIALSNEFYFVVPEGLIGVDEIPAECGLMVADNKTIRLIKKPDVNNEPLLSWHFVASIARRSGEVSAEKYQREKQYSSRLQRRLVQSQKEVRNHKRAYQELCLRERLLRKKNPELWREIDKEARDDEHIIFC